MIIWASEFGNHVGPGSLDCVQFDMFWLTNVAVLLFKVNFELDPNFKVLEVPIVSFKQILSQATYFSCGVG